MRGKKDEAVITAYSFCPMGISDTKPDKVKFVLVMVGEGIAPPTATPEPDVRLSPHPAPQSEGHCQDIRRLV